MNGVHITTDQDRARERVEAALRDHDYCSRCGGRTDVVVRGNALWVECETLRTKRGIQYELAAGLHDRHLVELPETILVAA